MEAVGSLAARIAHEVKNPLTQIRLGLDFLQEEVSPDRMFWRRWLLLQRAPTIISSLLDFSRGRTPVTSKMTV